MKHHFSIAMAAAALLSASLSAQASVAVYDFQNLPVDTGTPLTLTDAGVSATFKGPADADPGAFTISSNFPSIGGHTTYKNMAGDFLTTDVINNFGFSALTISFSAPVTAFTLDFALDNTDKTHLDSLTFATNAGDGGTATGGFAAESWYRYQEGTLSFSGAAFTSITFESDAFDFQIDNLHVTTAEVPEPASLLLLGACLPAFALARRRTRRAAKV